MFRYQSQGPAVTQLRVWLREVINGGDKTCHEAALNEASGGESLAF
jgi:hypothetical protein